MTIAKDMLTEGIKREHMPSVGRFFWRMALLLFVTYAIGGFAVLGMPGFASETEVSKYVDASVKEIKEKTQQTAEKVSDMQTALDEVLAELYMRKIRETVRQRCKTPVDEYQERERLNGQIEEYQKRYRKYAGERYPLPACGEL